MKHLLLDAALMGKFCDRSWFEARHARFVYEPHGGEAEMVGPALMPWVEGAAECSLVWAEQAPARFGVSLLTAAPDIPASVVLEHLIALHEIVVAPARRFYLRYADARVLTNLWQVLDRAQRGRLLGPLESWAVRDRQGAAVVHSRAGLATAAPAVGAVATHGLVLDRDQFRQLVALMAPDALLADLLEAQPALSAMGSEHDRWQWASDICARLGPYRYEHRLLALRAVLLSHGKNLREPAFLAAIQAAEATGDKAPLRAWQQASDAADTGAAA